VKSTLYRGKAKTIKKNRKQDQTIKTPKTPQLKEAIKEGNNQERNNTTRRTKQK
jgi:hypothetical protein